MAKKAAASERSPFGEITVTGLRSQKSLVILLSKEKNMKEMPKMMKALAMVAVFVLMMMSFTSSPTLADEMDTIMDPSEEKMLIDYVLAQEDFLCFKDDACTEPLAEVEYLRDCKEIGGKSAIIKKDLEEEIIEEEYLEAQGIEPEKAAAIAVEDGKAICYSGF